MTGLNPRKDIEPPLEGRALIEAIKQLREGKRQLVSMNTVEIQKVEVFDCGTQADGPFTVLMATLANGSIIGCYLSQPPPERERLGAYANSIPKDQWFNFNPDRPGASGI